MKKILLLFVLPAFFFCKNEKADELQKQLEIRDSIINGRLEQFDKQRKDLLKEKEILLHEIEQREKENKISIAKVKIDSLLVELNDKYARLESAKSNLNKISSFKLGRSQSTRDAEIKFAQSTVEQYNLQIGELEKQILALNPNWGK